MDHFDKRYWPGNDAGSHLEFFLKHEDAHLLVFTRILEALPPAAVEAIVRAAPTPRMCDAPGSSMKP